MGNSQSSPSSSNQSHRLSKPPTNSSSSNFLVIASQRSESTQSSPVSTSMKSFDLDGVKTSPQGPQRGRQDKKHKLRAQLFGAGTESPTRDSVEDDNDRVNSLSSLVNDVKRLSRSGSLISQNASARGSASQLINAKAGSRLSLVPESVPADSDEVNRVLQQIKDKAGLDEQVAIASRGFSSVPENDLIMATHTSIRRRSLFMPGIATRGTDILRKPPPPEYLLSQADRDYYFDPHHSESSPLSRIAALDLAEDGRRSPVVRTETPCDLDYSQLGSLKLGTLRIMNEAASPSPSERTLRLRAGRSTPDLRRNEDYFTASEGLSSDEEGAGDASQPKPSSLHRPYEGGDDTYVPPRATWKVKDSSPTRTGSPLRYERGCDSSDDEHVISRVRPEKKPRPLSLADCPALSPDGSKSIAQEYISDLTHIVPDEAPTIAQSYISQLPTSPFSYERSPSPDNISVLVASKATEYDDMLFEDEGIATSSGEEKESSKRDVVHRSSSFTRYFGPMSSSESSENDMMPSSAESGGRALGKPLSKTDSGYSSNASLRSVRNGKPSKSINSGLSEPRPSTFERNPSLPDIREDINLQRNALVQPKPPSSSRPSILTKPKPKVPSVVPLIESHRPSSEPVQTSISASSNRSTASSGPKKLQKPRPLSQPVPAKYITVQGYRELSQSHIPPVPSEIALKHAERLRKFPLLEHTYPSLNHTRSNETMSTTNIPTYVPIRFPSPSTPLRPDTGDSRDRPLAAPRPPPHRDYSSTKPSKSESHSSQQRTPSQIDFVTGISDFGTIGESLGASPYDAARFSLPVIPPRKPGLQSPHPHQIGSAITRVKSFTGMDAQEAAELARLRSKTLAERQQLPFALQQKIFDDRGGIPGKQPRPKSQIVNAPPVPPLSGTRDQDQECRPKTSGPSLDTNGQRALPQRPKSNALQASTKLRKAPRPQTTQEDLTPPKSSHAAAIEFHKSWEPHRQAWRQRHKSAGEGLLTRRSVSRECDQTLSRPNSATATVAHSLRPTVINVPAPPQHITSLSLFPVPEIKLGRYDGWLDYGFEPGHGVGGSAGTRSVQSAASRKGVDMSMGYGVDSSDVPIIRGLRRH
jgi:hypothetical protein